MKRLWSTVMLLCAAVVFGACSDSPQPTETLVDASVVQPPAEGDSGEEPLEAHDDGETDGAAAFANNAVFTPDAQIPTQRFAPIDPGQYRVDMLGTPISFELTGEWFIQPNESLVFVLSHPSSVGPDDRDIVFLRPRSLADPSNPSAAQGASWDIADIDGWIANVASTVEVTNRQTVMLGDRTAVRFDVTLADDVECGARSCVDFVQATASDGKVFQRGSHYRIYWVEDEYEPIVVVVGAFARNSDEWFVVADEFMSTLAFGDSVPHPAPTADLDCLAGLSCEAMAGNLTVPTAGGLSVELAEPRFVFQEPGLAFVRLDGPGGVAIFGAEFDMSGNPLASVTDVVDHLMAKGFTSSDAVVGDLGFEAVALDAEGVEEVDVLTWDESLVEGWAPAQATRVWILDTPRGPIVVSAEGFGESGIEPAVALAEAILATLQLVDLGE